MMMSIKKTLGEKNILYIVHNYTTFQKDSIEEAASYFNKVYVLVRYKPISRIAKYIPLKWIKNFDDSFVINTSKTPNNVEVIRTPVWYLPFGIFFRILGALHFRAVERAIKKHQIRFDLVHSHFIWSSGYVGMRLKEKYQVPFLVTGHGYDVYQLPFINKWWKNITKQILESAEVVLTVSESNEKCLLKLKTDASKIFILRNGYSSKRFHRTNKMKARRVLGIDLDKKIIITVGSLVSIKGHEYLIGAINILINEFPDLHLYIVGGGWLYKNLMSLISSNKLDHAITIVGHIPHDNINQFMNASDIFVLPSIRESFGVVQLEAMACGLPVVATRNGGSEEIITHPSYGILCEAENCIDLSRAISLSLLINWDHEKIIEYANTYSLENSIAILIELYKQFLLNSDNT